MILKEQHKLPFRVDRFADVPMLVGRFLKHSKGFQCFNMKHVMIFHRPGGASTVSTRKAEARPLERCEKIPDGDTTPKRTTMCVFFFFESSTTRTRYDHFRSKILIGALICECGMLFDS